MLAFGEGMAVLELARMGNPILRQVARELTPKEIRSSEIQKLILDMVDTMKANEGIGLAAPQVNQSIQLCVMQISPDNPRYEVEDEIPLQVICNPKITVLGDETREMWEGCLSVPGMRGLVRRPAKIRLEALDGDGKPLVWELAGLPATVVQHETDHLFGALYIDKLVDPQHFAYIEEYQKYWLPLQRAAEMPD